MANFGKQFAPNMDACRSDRKATFTGLNYRITVLSERLVRLEFNKDGHFSDEPTLLAKNRNFPVPIFKVEQDERYLVITTKYFMLQYIKNRPFEGPKFAPDSNLKVKLLNSDKLWYYGHPEARNFLADAFSLDNFKEKVDLQKGLYSTDGFASIDDSKTLIINERGFAVEDRDDKVDIYLFMYKRDFGLCLKDYFTLTTYPSLIPRYALGIWWNRDRIYSFNDTKEIVKTFNKYQIPLSVLLLSEFWHIKDPKNYNLYKTGFTFNEGLFPDPNEFVKYMHERGVKIGLNIDPTEGIRKEEESYTIFHQELHLKENENIPFNVLDKMFVMLYIEKLIDPLIKLDIDVFWLDYKENLKSLQALNYYYKENYKDNVEKRPLVLTRDPLIAPHNYSVLYSGETIVSWDTLKFLPFYNALSSNKGITWWSHDVGGFKDGIEDSELYLRYVQFSTFSPIFRFSAKRGSYYKREPWLWDIKTFTIAREYCWLRQRLIPYIYTEGYNYSKNGMPLIQPLYYTYPETFDEPLYKNEYYFGRELFVSPITKPMDPVMNRSVQRVFLPKGVWYDFKTGKKFIGNKRYVVFYKDEDYPLFAEAGAIIPLANLLDNKNDTNVPKSMEINVFPGKSNVYKLYEDDGFSKLYEQGFYIVTAIDYNYLKNNYTLIIHPVEGKTEIIPKLRDYKIRFRNTRKANNVEIYVNGDIAKNKMDSYEDENDFVVEVYDVDTTKQITINCQGKDIEIDAVHIFNEDINSIIGDLKITTSLKEQIASIMFSDEEVKRKRILIKKLKGLDKRFIKMFMKLLEFIAEI
ncbi:MAG: glycoside hydrolase family 31 protein [Bacilli bacterium]